MPVAVDSPERDVAFLPTKTPYDPRHMLAGTVGPDGPYGHTHTPRLGASLPGSLIARE